VSGQSERTFSLSWSHYVLLLGIKKADERHFYEIESTKQNWTLRELRRQFQSGLYERLALSRDQDGIRQLAKQGQIVSQPQDLLKEPLVLEFLGLSEQARYSESDLEAVTVGIVLCKKKHEALVEITLSKDANIHAREYQLYLPSKEELQQKLTEWADI
jgi:predicted nuclease of restriction endonuclease-like (RecB) superfamily